MARELAMPRTATLRTVFTKTLRDQRRALAWWTLGFVGTVFMYAAFWPNVRDNAATFTQYLDDFPEFIRNLMGGADFGTPEGYLQSELFSFLGPIMLLVYAIGAGARATAGEEEAGSLDLLLSVPIRRRRVLLDKFWALLAASLWLVLSMWLATVLLGPAFDLRPDLEGFTAACLMMFLLGLAFGTFAMAVGAWTGSKSLAVGVPGGVALVTFILNTLAPSVDWLEPYRVLSPFYYASEPVPILHGVDVVHAVVLVGISAVALAVALIAFERRDLAA